MIWDLYGINQNKFRQNITEFDIVQSIKEIMSIQRLKAESKGIDLISDFSSLKSTKINHDEMRIQQILLNFQSNAIKFTDTGSVTIRADVFSKNDESYLEIAIIDTGIGIKVEDKNKLFKLFGYV